MKEKSNIIPYIIGTIVSLIVLVTIKFFIDGREFTKENFIFAGIFTVVSIIYDATHILYRTKHKK